MLDNSPTGSQSEGGKSREIGLKEFIGFLSAAAALTALAIDTMLPAFSEIRSTFGFGPESTRVSLVVTVFFVGMASGQLVYGPISDRFGRKRALAVGLGIYILGAIGSTLAPGFGFLLASRLLWGIGSAGPRVVGFAILRDRYSGDQLARIMLFVQAIFMIVPILAPIWGQLWLSIGSWRWTFGQAIVLAALVAVWSTRLPETLAESNRRSLQIGALGRSVKEILSHRQTLGMAMAQTLLFGAFFPWLGSSELIIRELYGRENLYPLVFAGMGIAMALAALLSSKAVTRFGSRILARYLVTGSAVLAGLATVVTLSFGGLPPFGVFLVSIGVLLALSPATSPNIIALALEPMGHIAGVTSSVVGTMNFAGGAYLGYLIDRQIDGTVTPLFVGAFIYTSLALVCVLWATSK